MTKKRNRLIAVGIALLLIIAAALLLIPGKVAGAEAWDGTTVSDHLSGEGTEASPYLISNGAELALFAKKVNSTDSGFDKCFRLTADIDLGGNEWTPIGGSYDVSFVGKFDGNGKTISNLKLTTENAGLFGYNDGTIKNVYLDKVNVVLTEGNGAALCAVNYGGTIEGCAVLGGNFDVSNFKYAAAICYENKGTINRCYNAANVTAASCAGIVFQNYSDGTVSNCYNAGEVSGIDALGEIGGICARNNGKIKFCLNYGELKNGQTVGGICASKYSGEGGGITSCYSNSDVCSAAAIGKDWDNSTTSDVGTKTTEEICDPNFLTSVGFSSEWKTGKVEKIDTDSLKRKTVKCTYPRLVGVNDNGNDLISTGDIYNFGTDTTPEWKPVTVIYDANELKAISDDLGGNYVLGDVIDLGGVEWTPIGSEGSPFTGLFSGDGKTISNLKLEVGGRTQNVGLFGYNSGTINNVYLDKVNVAFDSVNGAALCAVNNVGGTIEGCGVLSGSINGSNLADPNGAAGICSKNDGTISKCYNLADVTVDQNGAGIAAFNNGTVSNCYNAGTIKGVWVGGICYNNSNSKIEYCLNFGKINGKSSAGISAFMENTTITKSYTDVNCSKNVYYATYGTNNSIDGEPLTTEEICDPNFLTSVGFGSDWKAGKVDKTDTDSKKRKAVKCTYPSLDGVTQTVLTRTADIYNFGTDTDTDWKPVTVINNNADELKAISDNLGGNYVLGENIDLGGVEWTPIGSEGSPFTGLFSGDGHTISNLKVTPGKGEFGGLFRYNSGTIKDVYLADIDVYNRNGAGAAGLCAVNNSGATIDGCAVLSGNVLAENTSLAAGSVGGICSNNYGTINRCYNMASVKTNVDGAGVVNVNQKGGTVSNCYNAGEVSSIGNGSGTVIGGISSQNRGKIEYCFNYGNVNNADIVGGICGQNDDNPDRGTISSCYSDSTVCKADAVGTGKKLTNVEAMTTEQLCDKDFCYNKGFDNKVWVGGIYDGRTASSLPSRFGKIDIIYPFLNGVGEKYMIRGEAYNFKTDGADDWQRYTLITTPEELAAINDNLDGNYVLGKDIDLTGKDWTPIGSTSGAFTGKFSGDGHTIKGVKVDVKNQYENAGLFGYSTGVIMNLAVEGDISGTNTVGGICGSNSAADGNGIIYACSFKGTVKGTGNNIGGICGYNFEKSKISNCFSAADVNGDNEVGGICGYNGTSATVSNTISVCTVSGTGNLVAAVCGKNDGTLTNNYFDKDVCSLVGAKDNNGAECASGTFGKPTKALCDETRMQEDLDTNMWNLGNIPFAYDGSNARKRVTTYTYPSIKDVGEAYSVDVKEYNFSTDGNPSWRTYTEIGTAEEFIAIGNDESKWVGNYVLTADIDLSGKTVNPIGADIILAFTGNFSGDGHTISGVNISSNGNNVGLFGYAGNDSGDYTTIMNLAVEGDIVGEYNVGGICGYGYEKVNIFACSFKGSVSGKDCVGGICGIIYKSCYIENCFNSGTIEATGEVTGDVGGLLGYVSDIGTVNNSINVGVVTGKNPGPICGAVSNILNAEYNYYNSDIFSGTDSYGTPKTTDELCADDALTALNLDTKIWQAGGITSDADPDYSTNARMRVANTNYPSLIGVGEPYSLGDVKQYNFKTTGDVDDWQEYIEITSAADLEIIRNNLGGNYVLMKDITLGDFTPIGSQDAPFTGKFSGNGNKITAKNAGIFGYNSGTIMNLAVEGNITGGNNVGSICGYNNGMIYACSFNGSVKGGENVGGISGYNSGTGTITNCYAIGSVEATVDYSGGICGVNDGGKQINCCYFAGTSVAPNNYNAICKGASPNCYFDRELYNINNYGNDALTTEALCGSSLPYQFSDEIWETGEFSVKSTEGKFRTVSFTYPRLKEGCAAYTVNDVKQYNFKTDGNDNWAQFNEINSLDDLNNINKNHHINYVLMKDIDLNEGTFSPILPNTSFWGNFSGDGHTIKGDIVGNKPRNGDFTALFSNNSGLIMNLALKCDVSGADLVGGICGRNHGTIYGCSFEGSVKGKNWVGGICGEMRSSEGERISNCYVIGTIEATDKAGGISGSSRGASNSMGLAVFVPPRIENCYFVGNVTVPENAQKDAITVKTSEDKYVLTLTNCYYNKDIYTGSTTNGTAKTTEELCNGTLLNGFNGSVWEPGKNGITNDSNKRMRVQEIVYPSLKNVGEPYSLGKVKQYNFGIDSEDWQEYTEIKNAAEFIALGNDSSKWGGNYVLTADIDLKNQPVKPIGNRVDAAFTGKFSGDGHTISNVEISGDKNVGLFGFCKDDAKIMNLAVVNGDISGSSNVGGICGYLFSENKVGSITNCSFEGSVKGEMWVGGICGIDFNGIISNCYAIADVEATGFEDLDNSAGGICGLYSPGTPNKGKISNCYFAGTVTGSDASRIDAICGADSSSGGITNCYYNSDLYTADSTKGTGLSTVEMTSSSALFEMSGFNTNVWVKTANTAVNSSGKNGVAYYPALKESNHVPSVKFTASLTFERTGTDALTFLDEFEVKYGGVIEFANGVTVTLDNTNCGLSAVDSNDKSVCDFSTVTVDTFTITVSKVGSNTYTFKCKPHASLGGFMPNEGLTKSFAINAAKYTLKPEDFEVKALVQGYNGKAGIATVEVINTALKQSGGYGDITVRYFDSDNKEVVPINAGEYTVKIDVTEGTNCKAATALTSPLWNQLEITPNPFAPSNYEFSVSKGTTTYTLSVVDLPDDLGNINKFEMTHELGNYGVITAAERKGKNIIFTLDGSKGAVYEETVKIYIDSQNYSPFGFDVTVNVNGKGTQNAPNCEVTLTHDGNGADTYTATITAVKGAQYSFDGKTWSDSNTLTGIKHGAKVNASIRMKETAELNASENVTKTLTADADLKWKSDKDGHWQECSKCDYKETSHSAHIFNGNSCAVCGYKKSGGSTGGGGSSSGGGGGSHSGGGSSGGGSSRPRNPAVDGKEMTWNDVTNEINKLTEGGEATIDLNGNTTVPKDVIKAIADKKALVTIKVNSTFSWTIDGSKLTESDITDMDFKVSVMTASGTETLRGTVGTGFKIENVTDKAVLNITFKAAHSGKFANLYKKVDGKLEFVDNVKIDENGNAIGLEVYEKGEYAVMLGELSDRPGDMDNDGILNAKDALAVLKDFARLITGKNPLVCDLNGDGYVNANDALIILKMAAGLIKI